MTNKSADLEALEQYAKAIGLGFVLGAEEVAKQHGVVVSAAGWVLATFIGDKIEYRSVVAFAVGPQGIMSVHCAQRYRPEFSAIVDPISNQFICLENGRVFTDEQSFLAAMRAAHQFELDADRPVDVAH